MAVLLLALGCNGALRAPGTVRNIVGRRLPLLYKGSQGWVGGKYGKKQEMSGRLVAYSGRKLNENEFSKAVDYADKMKRAGWNWPFTGVFQNYDWETIRSDLEMEPFEAFALVVATVTYFRTALNAAASFASLEISTGMEDGSVWSFITAACAGYFAVGVLRDLWKLKQQSDLNELYKETKDLKNLDNIMMEALSIIRDDEEDVTDDEIREEMREAGMDSFMAEWDPEGVLPKRDSDEEESEGFLAGMEERRGQIAANAFRSSITGAVKAMAERKPEAGSALDTLSSLDSMMSGFAENDPELSPESLGVSKDLIQAAERLFQRYDENGSGVLSPEEIREMARSYEIPLPGDKELKAFVKSIGGSDESRLSEKEFLLFWAEAETQSGEVISSAERTEADVIVH
eukprot:CAMPEP_0167764248 /NCGR_PEP_ID=MMETSP0110_2-20121227/13906_1 /TAXON_ID=629695 /ORGANISM="Gymnochlora sp., Strain CCMP2014" /LENGTH=401 /DNA_ID=CAMNT_0007651589 /DNA_START=14 /DNA_END=1219 /DNA_ORIENTATION=+